MVLGPMVEDRDDSSPLLHLPEYTRQSVHNCLMDSGASHNLMPKSRHGRIRVRSHQEPIMTSIPLTQEGTMSKELIKDLKSVSLFQPTHRKV